MLMKKFLLLLFLNFSWSAIAQIPNLNLNNKVDSTLQLPKKLQHNEICIVYKINNAWSAYDFARYYFLNDQGVFKVYEEQIPKNYLKNKELKIKVKEVEITKLVKDKMNTFINSTQLNELLKHTEKDFEIDQPQSKQNSLPPPCMISDSNAYTITFIQNNRRSSYSRYAPRYYYEKCPNITINKPVLKKFIDVLDLFK